MQSKAHIFFGIDRFLFESDQALRGKKAGLLTNESATTANIPGARVPSRLALKRSGIILKSILINRHGLFLEGPQRPIPTTDPLTQLPIVDLATNKESELMDHLNGLDAVMVDLPDSGIRFLSALDDLIKLMQVSAKLEMPLWILDRPNPLGGQMRWVEGPLQEGYQPQVSSHFWSLPIRHSLTLGEIATLWNRENGQRLKLHTVTAGGWKRKDMWPQLKLPFTPPHPAIIDFRTNLLAACTGLLSGINVNIGLGSPWAFRIVVAPWLDPMQLITAIQEVQIKGVVFRPFYMRPSVPPFAGEICGGIMLHLTSASQFQPVETGFRLLQLIFLGYGQRCQWRTVDPQGVAHPTSRHFQAMVGRKDIVNELPRMPSGRGDQIRTWTQARNWRGFARHWLHYS